MSKEAHMIRVWARHGDQRTLEFSTDAPDARRRALARVHELQAQDDVEDIVMREHLVLTEALEIPAVRRRSLHWVRTGHKWREMPGTNVPVLPS